MEAEYSGKIGRKCNNCGVDIIKRDLVNMYQTVGCIKRNPKVCYSCFLENPKVKAQREKKDREYEEIVRIHENYFE